MEHESFEETEAQDADGAPAGSPRSARSGSEPRGKPVRITDSRLIVIETALPSEALRLKRLQGEEALSRLFRFELELVAQDPAVDFKQVVGRGVTVRVKLADATPRYFNGIISRIAQTPAEGGSATFKAELVPWTWLLTRTANCRIFQKLSVPAIVERLFQTHGFKDFSNRLQQKYPERDYVVQYRETDFNFMSRLLEDAGIWYFFEHENGRHTLVLCDSSAEHHPCPSQEKARITRSQVDGNRMLDVITAWSVGHELRPGRYALGAFNFETPNTNLGVNVESVYDSPTGAKPEVYDFPGGYTKRADGDTLVRLRIEEEEAQALQIRGASTCRAFRTGYRFELTDHPRKELNQGYALTSIFHEIYEPQIGSQPDEEASPPYINRFTCLPLTVPFRPRRVTPRPVIHGVQTAIVVGPKGEDLFVDKHGRVKVQFHWDREGKRDENSSCWVRVAQNWAGKRWGTMFLPRVGQEVLVEFVEGDPDSPLVTGRLYNGDQTPPYELPAEQTKSTIRSNTPKGGGFNELRFDDKKDAEQVFIHGQRDLDLVIKRDAREWLGGELHVIVEKSRLEQVNEESHLKVSGNRVEEVGKDLSVKAGRLIIESAGTITLKAAGGFVQIDAAGVTIQGTVVNINSGGTPATAATALRLPVRASSAGEAGGGDDGPEVTDAEDPQFDLVVAYYEEQYAKHRDKMSPEDQKKTEALLAKLKAAAAKKDAAALKSSAQELHTQLETATGETIPPPPGFVAAGVDKDGHTILAEKPIAAPVSESSHAVAQLRGRLVADGRVFRAADGQLFRPVFASALTALAPGKPYAGFFDWARATGFNGVRIFAGALKWAGQTPEGARAALPKVLEAAADRGLYVEVTCLTDSGTGYDKDQHLREIAAIVKGMPHVIIEIANEFTHSTQDRQVNDPGWLRGQLGVFREGGHPVAIGAPGEDEPDPAGRWNGTGGSYGTAHLDRGRDKWNQVRRVREIMACSETSGVPVLNNEPIGAAEPGTSGQRRNDPEFFFTLGALNRLFEVGGVFHFQDGLNTTLPVGPTQQQCAAAFVRASHCMDSVSAKLTYKNANNTGKWPDSPVGDAGFDRTIIRAYSGVAGNDGFTILVGVTGDPGVRWANGWNPVKTVGEMPGVQVIAIKRA